MITKPPTTPKVPESTGAAHEILRNRAGLTPTSLYYSTAYLSAVEQLEDKGRVCVFRYGDAIVPLILRPLPGGQEGFDATTPYDFSGPWLGSQSAADTWTALCDWSCSHGVVCAFLRFHPYESCPQDWNDLEGLEVTHTANHVRVDLGVDTDAVVASFKPTVRRDLQVAKRSKVTTLFQPFTSQSVDVFSSLYWDTMERRHASEYYKFPKAFFEALANNLSDVCSIAIAQSGDRVVAAALILLDGRRAFYYLACSDEDGRKSCAMNRLVHDTVIVLARRGITQFHLGGGTEGLLAFKQRFGPAGVAFHIGRAVFDADRYAELSHNCRSDFFPAYRAPRESAGL